MSFAISILFSTWRLLVSGAERGLARSVLEESFANAKVLVVGSAGNPPRRLNSYFHPAHFCGSGPPLPFAWPSRFSYPVWFVLSLAPVSYWRSPYRNGEKRHEHGSDGQYRS